MAWRRASGARQLELGQRFSRTNYRLSSRTKISIFAVVIFAFGRPSDAFSISGGPFSSQPSARSTPRKTAHTPLVMMAKAKTKKAPATTSTKGFGSMPTSIGKKDLLIDAEYADFMQWLKNGGSIVGKVAFANDLRGIKGLRGVVCGTQPIEAGDAVVTIPREMAITLGTEAKNPGHADQAKSAGFAGAELARIKNDPVRSKKWKPYIDILPTGESLDNAIFYPAEDLALTEWPIVITETQERLAMLRQTHADLQAQLDPANFGGGSSVSWEDFLWGVFQVESRVFTIYEEVGFSGKKVGTKFAVPMIDMFNHDSASPHELKCTKDGLFKVVAGRKILPGQEINIVYGGGVLNNDRIFQDYGFVEANNSEDVKQVLMDKSDTATLHGASGLGLDAAGIRGVLASFSTSKEEDEALLAAASLSGFAATAIRFRMEKKKAMLRALELLESGVVNK